MPRVLQLCDHQPDFQTRRAVGQLCTALGSEFEVDVKTVGTGGHHLNVPAAAFALRRKARQYDLVHAWGGRALLAAAFGAFERLLFTPTEFPSNRLIRWLVAIMNYRDVNVLCPTATIHRQFVERGVPMARCHIIRPGVDFSRIKKRRDAELRAKLGFAENQKVILLAGESTRAASHQLAIWAGTVLKILDPTTAILLWGRGPLARSVAGFGPKLNQPDLVTVAESKLGRAVEFEEILPAADMMIVSATGPVATLPIAIAMAGGVPIVASVTPTVAELLEDRHTALMTQPNSARALALRVQQLQADPQLQWSLADVAKTQAYDYFAQSRFLEQHRQAYGSVAVGKPIEVITPPSGAGSRFHARV